MCGNSQCTVVINRTEKGPTAQVGKLALRSVPLMDEDVTGCAGLQGPTGPGGPLKFFLGFFNQLGNLSLTYGCV